MGTLTPLRVNAAPAIEMRFGEKAIEMLARVAMALKMSTSFAESRLWTSDGSFVDSVLIVSLPRHVIALRTSLKPKRGS